MATCKQCGGALDSETGGICSKCLMMIASANTEIEKPLTPGSVFHNLEIVEMLGRGGMGIVYKARQPQLDRFVAVKILPPTLGRDPDFAERFAREAKALASLQHPNIVAVHDFGKEGNRYFFVMEFVDGTNLRPMLKEKLMSPKEALKIVPVLCTALEYAHSEGVVHRDIKPENILIDKKGRVKIADFGLAKMLNKDASQQRMTHSNMIMGTMHYMAPEQMEDAKSVDHRADIYSMGVVIYEMLTGELPIGRFAPPSKAAEGVDVRLDEVVMRALEKHPEKRYQRMDEVGREVSRITVNGSSPRTQSAARRSRWQAAAIVAAVGAALTIILMGKMGGIGGKPTQTNAEQSGPKDVKQVKLETFALATLAKDEVPEGWTIGEHTAETASRSDVIKAAAGWGMQGHAEGIEKFSRLQLLNADDKKIWITAFQCKDASTFDACLRHLQDKYFPQHNHRLLEKERVLVLLAGEKEGRVTPAVEHIEDKLRAKIGLPGAVRKDPSALKEGDLPATWIEKQQGVKLNAENLRDGWMKTFFVDGKDTVTLDVASWRFFESDQARAFAQKARSAEPAKGEDVRVLQEYERAVVITLKGGDAAQLKTVDQMVEKLMKRFGSSSDRLNLRATTADVKLDDANLTVTFDVDGISGRELTRSGKWKFEMWSSFDRGMKFDMPAPEFLRGDGKLRFTANFAMKDDLKRFFETTPSWLDFRVHWNDADKEPFDVSVSLDGKYPKSFEKSFGRLLLSDDDIPTGWAFAREWRHMRVPVVALEEESKRNILSIFKSLHVIDEKAVDMAYLAFVQPEKTKTEAEGAAFVVIKFTDKAAMDALLAKLKDALPAKADACKAKAAGDVLLVSLLYGTAADGATAFDKVRESIQKKME